MKTDEERKAAKKLANERYKATRTKKQLEADKANRREIQRNLRARRLEEGIKSRTLMLDDQDYKKVLEFMSSFNLIKNGESK
jgi:hypothetical protein